MTDFPKEINALISTYLENRQGDYFRDQTGDFIIKEIRNGNTYGNGVLHSFNDMPAVIQSDIFNNIITQEWYQNGKLHRDNDMPALVRSNGIKIWYKNGLLHRDNDLPAIFFSGVINKVQMYYQEWYQNGKKHRDNDLPAVIEFNGTQKWYKNGIKYNK